MCLHRRHPLLFAHRVASYSTRSPQAAKVCSEAFLSLKLAFKIKIISILNSNRLFHLFLIVISSVSAEKAQSFPWPTGCCQNPFSGRVFVNRHGKKKPYTYLLEGGNYPLPGRYGLQYHALLCQGSQHFIESCQFYFFIPFKDPRGLFV